MYTNIINTLTFPSEKTVYIHTLSTVTFKSVKVDVKEKLQTELFIIYSGALLWGTTM